MTPKELAALLTGREIGDEITPEIAALAKKHKLVIVYGASDDLIEIAGAFVEEFGAYDGGSFKIDKQGPLPDREQIDDDDELQAYFKREPKSKTVEALWCKEGDYSWTYKTTIPHETFEIVEDGEPYCRGIVFKLADV